VANSKLYVFLNVGYSSFVKAEQYVNYAMKRTSYISMGWWWSPFWTKPKQFFWMFVVLAHWYNSPRIDMSLHPDTTLSWFLASHSLLLLLNVACVADNQQIPILEFWVWSFWVL